MISASKKEFFKLKLVIVLGYNGLQFHGMQKNLNVATIEETLEKALFDSELILDHNFNNLQKIKWSRAARTDKGVHAIANVVNCKLSITSKFLLENKQNPEEDNLNKDQGVVKIQDKRRIDWKKVINVINGNLPSSIKVHTIKQITKAFDVKQSARSRIYEYLGPIEMFIKEKEITPEVEQKTLERLKTLSAKFKGTHNFHNYTTKMRASDPRVNRFIMEMDCEMVDYVEKGKFFKFRLRGQSFIYHQIRKIIGIMVQVIHQDYKDQFIDNSFYQNSIGVWLAPPQGLLLDRVTFEAYNKKIDIPEKLEFTEEEEAQLKDFKENTIYPIIVDAEFKDKMFSIWLTTTKGLEAEGKVQAMESSGGEEDEEGEGQKGSQKKGKKKGRDNRNSEKVKESEAQIKEKDEDVQ